MSERKRYKLRRVSYSYHPDFIEDPCDPKGYRVLDTGRWIVEWDLIQCPVLGIISHFKHYTRSFLTEEQAKEFESRLIHGTRDYGFFIMSRNKKFYVNED